MSLDPVELLRRLVSIPSVNPMDRPFDGPEYGEARLTACLEEVLSELGLRVERQAVAPGQDNLLARLDGDPAPDRGGSLLMLAAHQDTVPTGGMSIAPFVPELRDGRVYGRGACDVKGGMAAMIAALSRLVQTPAKRRPTVVLACTVNEECGFTGASTLAESWHRGPTSIFPRRPDWAIVAEPTGLDVVVAHKGVVRWRCHTRGRAAHSSRPDLGENAIYKMARVVQHVERYQNEVLGASPEHPLCGRATLSVGVIHGGVSVNVVPDRCTIEIDRRLPPGEDPVAARRHLIDYLAALAGQDGACQHDPASMCGPPLDDARNAAVAQRVRGAVTALGGACRCVGVPYATDAAFFAAVGVPTVVCGPGHLEQAHTADEWIAVEQLMAAVDAYQRVLLL